MSEKEASKRQTSASLLFAPHNDAGLKRGHFWRHWAHENHSVPRGCILLDANSSSSSMEVGKSQDNSSSLRTAARAPTK